MNHFLKNEIIKHILNCVGVSAKGVSGRGLADPTFRLPNQELVLTYDGSGDVAHAVYTARIDLGDSIFHGCLVDLSIDDSSEFLFGICLDDSKIMALSCDFNLPDGSVDNKFIVLDENKEMWFDVDTFTANTEEYGLEPEHSNVVLYRIGAKDNAFNSGNCALRLSN